MLVVAAVFAARAIRDDDDATPEPATTSGRRPRPTTTAALDDRRADDHRAPTTTAPAPTDHDRAAAPTTAPPGPCGTDTGPIRAAVDAAVADAQANADLASCRLAASDPTWAAVQLAAKPGAQFDALTVIVHGGAGSWTVVARAAPTPGAVGPQQVIVDLGQFCAGTGGDGTE